MSYPVNEQSSLCIDGRIDGERRKKIWKRYAASQTPLCVVVPPR